MTGIRTLPVNRKSSTSVDTATIVRAHGSARPRVARVSTRCAATPPTSSGAGAAIDRTADDCGLGLRALRIARQVDAEPGRPRAVEAARSRRRGRDEHAVGERPGGRVHR